MQRLVAGVVPKPGKLLVCQFLDIARQAAIAPPEAGGRDVIPSGRVLPAATSARAVAINSLSRPELESSAICRSHFALR